MARKKIKMIYKHRENKDLYRYITKVFDVNTQSKKIVYCCLKTGVLFTRCIHDFEQKFTWVEDDVEDKIIPKY